MWDTGLARSEKHERGFPVGWRCHGVRRNPQTQGLESNSHPLEQHQVGGCSSRQHRVPTESPSELNVGPGNGQYYPRAPMEAG